MLYEYDYQDRRVVKDEGGSGRIYIWDEVFGEVIWELPLENPSSPDVVRGFFNGRLVVENDARPGAGFHFMHRDHLGSSKLMTDFFSPVAVCDETYHPFGQLQSGQPAGCNAHVRKFTGKERDAESELDYFGARYSDSLTGRFLSADPALESADLGNPQTWNRFAYVINNPLVFVDPDGRELQFSGSEEQRRELEKIAASGLPSTVQLVINDDGTASLQPTGNQGSATPEQQAFADILEQAISSPKTTSISLLEGKDRDRTLIADFGRQEIDLGDVSMFGNGPGISQASTLGHEIQEQFLKQSKGKDAISAHTQALKSEESISGFVRGRARVDDRPRGPDFIYVPLARKNERMIVIITVQANNVVKVVRR